MGVKMSNINRVWARIKAHQTKVFRTKRGKKFSYKVTGEGINVINRNGNEYAISRKYFAETLKHVPVDGPGEINTLVWGPTYIWAILHDSRIRAGEW